VDKINAMGLSHLIEVPRIRQTSATGAGLQQEKSSFEKFDQWWYIGS